MTEVSGGLVDNIEVDEQQDAPEVDSREVREVVRVESEDNKPITEKPEDLPDAFWNDKEGSINTQALTEQYQKDQKRITDLRKTISKGTGGTPAESVDDYVVEFDDTASQYVPEDDAALGVAKKAALDAGIPVEKFKEFAPKYINGLIEAGLLNESALPKTEEQERAELDQHRDEQMKLLGDGGERIINRLTDRVSTLYNKGSLNKDDLEAFKEAAFDAKGVLFLEKWINLHSSERSIPTDHVLDEGMATKEELDAMAADPRMSDPAFRAKRTAGYKALEARGALS